MSRIDPKIIELAESNIFVNTMLDIYGDPKLNMSYTEILEKLVIVLAQNNSDIQAKLKEAINTQLNSFMLCPECKKIIFPSVRGLSCECGWNGTF